MRIRYHHLMCVPRFIGKGYSEDFCANMALVKEAIESNEYELTDKCDDICAQCPNNIDGVCIDNDKVARYDEQVKARLISALPLKPELICSDCKWYYICKNM